MDIFLTSERDIYALYGRLVAFDSRRGSTAALSKEWDSPLMMLSRVTTSIKSPPAVMMVVVCLLCSITAAIPGVASGESTIQLDQELWRTEPDNEPYFRIISKIILDPDTGEYFVSDNISNAIHVMSAEGVYLRSFHVQGEGPGKILSLVDFELVDNGRLAMLSPIGPKITYITRSGDPVYDALSEVTFYSGDQAMSNCYYFDYREGIYVIAGEQSYKGRLFVAVFSEWGDYLRDLLTLDIRSKPGIMIYDDHDDFILSHQPWLFASNGLVYISQTRNGIGQYTIAALSTGGERIFELTHPIEPAKRTHDDIQALQAEVFNGEKNYKMFHDMWWDVVIPNSAPDVSAIFEIDGQLWVECNHSRTAPPSRSFDTFSFDGRYIDTIQVFSKSNRIDRDGLYLFQDTAILVPGGIGVNGISLGDDVLYLQLICYSTTYMKR